MPSCFDFIVDDIECRDHVFIFSTFHRADDDVVAFVDICDEKIVHARVGFDGETSW